VQRPTSTPFFYLIVCFARARFVVVGLKFNDNLKGSSVIMHELEMFKNAFLAKQIYMKSE
jgi:hypothetical protein